MEQTLPEQLKGLQECPHRGVLDLIFQKWTVIVIYHLHLGPRRYNQLHHDIDGISHKMLAQTLRQLEFAGIVKRTVYPHVPPQVEYALTPLGATLIEPLNVVAQWTHDHAHELRLEK
ncbi:helix-turn-helix transcriptional regulator [Paenibacillus mesophilus]|uniref:winged helix-turn-helix transcriptional regulator n=1 Tax=Paenibacillus mesophilus TaxID=2582849 RepID=UPI00110F47F5|nr:helix-turn-helix domain-containing protein [Paenibacillus mesophilus]TMV49150.1 helix-turn-helix transcriptional regulator [Paenibacillus mesophilus]